MWARRAAPAVPTTLEELASVVHSTALKVQRIEAYDDRLGSAVRRLWHQTLTILLLLGIMGLMVWNGTRVKPEILPYLYVVDTQGEILWKGVPGTYEIRDVAILNHLEKWIIDARERTDDPTFLHLWKAWTRADELVERDSLCNTFFQKYMRESDPRQASRRPRVDVKVLTKKIRQREENSGEYRLTWQEIEVGKSGQMLSQTLWEGDFLVVFEVPKTFAQAQATDRYGVLLRECSWSPQSTLGGS